MKKFFHKIVFILTAVIVASTQIGSTAVQVFADNGGRRTISISDADEFLAFAENCRIDSYSKGLNVSLDADISLSGRDFFGVPIFCGTFDGGGHTVSGFSVHGSASEIGLFRHAERGAVIKNLTVTAAVTPGGSGDTLGGIVGSNRGTIASCEFRGVVSGNSAVGGIAGVNGETGVISGCKSSASVSAESYAGGIAGRNFGVILDCTNSGNINTVYDEASISAEDLDLENITSEKVIGKSDIGGIAGYSSGMIQRCSNSGTVGYQHTGYNIGGLVGRQCGTLLFGENTGHVYGRKDVGGIAGQMEPYRSIEFSEDSAQRLDHEMKQLSESVDRLMSDARAGGGRLNSDIQTLTAQMNAAQKNADEIADRTEAVFNGYSDGINELLARGDLALDGAIPAFTALDEAVVQFGQFSDKCAEALSDLEEAGEYSGDAVDAARDALKDIDNGLPKIESSLRDIGNSLREMKRSLGDPEETKRSLKNILSSFNGLTDELKRVSDAVGRLDDAFSGMSEWLNGPDWQALRTSVSALSDSFADVLAALADVSAATGDIAAAIDSGEMDEALSAFLDASKSLGRAAAKLAEAVRGGGIPDEDALAGAAEELEKAADELQTAADHLSAAVDPDQMKEAMDELQTAARQLERALERASAVTKDISDALNRITGSSVPKDTLNQALAQMDALANSISNMSDRLADVNRELGNILDKIDASGLTLAMDQLVSAVEGIAGAVGDIQNAGDDFDRAAEALGKAMDALTAASSAAGDAANILSGASESLSEAVEQIEDVAETLSEKPEVRFPALDESFTSAADSLAANMSAMITTLSRIGNRADAQGTVLMDDVENIRGHLQAIADIFRDTYRDLLSEDEETRGFSEDISERGTDSRQGSAVGCKNSGMVEGDVNVGGITGAMAIEFDLDPEDDIIQNGDRSANFSYHVMDVIDNCENLGEIHAKKNYCGGIVGRMDMGLVRASRSSGTVASTDGSYIGGIAGYSTAKVRGCYAKVSLSGRERIGGIAGEGGIITDCLSIVDITDFSERAGAVLGYVDFSKENTEISNNFFVDRGIAGIDRVSYSGMAEPVSYAEFAKKTGDFAEIVVEFISEGKTLARVAVPYGGSLKPSDIPDIPQKSGYYARWEEFDFDHITFSRVLHAEYFKHISLIASEKASESGLPLVLADGEFDDSSAVLVETESSSVFAPAGGELRIVTLEAAGPVSLRFLNTGENPKLMQYINGAWKPVDFTVNGSYLIVEEPLISDGKAIFSVSSATAAPTLIIAVVSAAAVLTAAGIALIVKKKK